MGTGRADHRDGGEGLTGETASRATMMAGADLTLCPSSHIVKAPGNREDDAQKMMLSEAARASCAVKGKPEGYQCLA
jgi:hypothetical protein